MTDENINPSRIMETATGYWKSALLLNAVKLELFPQFLPLESPQMSSAAERDGLCVIWS